MAPMSYAYTHNHLHSHSLPHPVVAPVQHAANYIVETTGLPLNQPFFLKYQAAFILLFLVVGFGIIFSIAPVYRMIKEWRKGKKVEDVEAPSVISSFKPPTITVPPPSFGTESSIRAELQARQAKLERDARYMGYVSQGKMLSGKGKGFFG